MDNQIKELQKVEEKLWDSLARVINDDEMQLVSRLIEVNLELEALSNR